MSRSHKIWVEANGGGAKSFGIGNDSAITLNVYVGTSASNSNRMTKIKLECHEDAKELHFYVNIDGQDYRLQQFDRKTKEFSGITGRKIDGSIEAQEQRQEDANNSLMRMTGMVATIGNIFCDTTEAKNDWKKRMLAAGLSNSGLTFPEDWNQLSEEEKETRLNAAIETITI